MRFVSINGLIIGPIVEATLTVETMGGPLRQFPIEIESSIKISRPFTVKDSVKYIQLEGEIYKSDIDGGGFTSQAIENLEIFKRSFFND